MRMFCGCQQFIAVIVRIAVKFIRAGLAVTDGIIAVQLCFETVGMIGMIKAMMTLWSCSG